MSRTVPGSELKYYLVPYDENCQERYWRDRLVSKSVIQALIDQPITDVFMFSHGWRGDVDEAINQYDKWIAAMAACPDDLANMRQKRRSFRPLLVGLHWPSLPFGDEELRGARDAFRVGHDLDRQVDRYAKRIADTRRSRRALRTILTAGDRQLGDELPRDVADAFSTLHLEAGLRSNGATGAPGTDCERFVPEKLYRGIRGRAAAHRAGNLVQAIDDLSWPLQMLGYLSFWKMKDRARGFGETGANALLRSMQQVVASDRDVRFHLMGHSFGSIVMSACLTGPPGRGLSAKPISSLALLQGALSLWSFCTDIESAIAGLPSNRPATPGYFRPILDRRLVRGPFVTTQSIHDYAVGDFYPWAAWLGGQLVYGQADALPKYGAIGSFGAKGPGCEAFDIKVRDARFDYQFQNGRIYNIDCSPVISVIEGYSGAHNDICHREIAHLVWQAAQSDSYLPPAVPQPVNPPPLPAPTRRRRRFIRH